MKQLRTILGFELKSYFKNKTFIGVTIFMISLIAVVMFFPRLIPLFEQEDSLPEEAAIMLVKADDPTRNDILREAFGEVFSHYNVQITDAETGRIKEEIRSGKAECAFILTSPTSFLYYIDDLAMGDHNTETAEKVLQQIYQLNTMVERGMTPQKAREAMEVQIESRVERLGKDQRQNFFYTYIMIFALYMVILLYGQMVATNVATEKSSRAMELLITSAEPTAMMFGKVIASCFAGFVQLVVVFGSALFFYRLNKPYWGENGIIDSIFNIPLDLLLYMLVFFILGFLIYAFMFSAVASTASRLEDINTSVMPITMVFVIAFVIVMTSMSSGEVDGTLMVICSYVPFTSPMAMFTRIAMSTVAWYEILISVLILMASTLGIGILSAKIYRVGVLMYGTTPKLGNLIKAIRKA